ncbi:MAG: hypothetical protein ACR2PX_27645 [Endozoicomonas sp.]|uniref:hypothetical protein n=1 Tax=Endozoicomonas sp. TaxID=1892382 RepID=UPI003D9B3FF7
MAAGPVWATDYSSGTVVRSSGSDEVDVVNVTGNLSDPGSDIITIDTGGTAEGIVINDNFTVDDTSNTIYRSILINDGASLTGAISNAGHIDDGITIGADATLTGSSFYTSTGAGSTNTGTLLGGLEIISTSSISSDGDTVAINDHAYVDIITVSGTLSTSGDDSSAILVNTGGQLGGNFNSDGAGGNEITRNESATIIQVDGTISSTSVNDGTGGAAINIAGSATGKIAITANGSITTGSIDPSLQISGTYQGTIDNSGTVDSGIVVTSTGTHTATGASAYQSSGSNSETATLTGGYTIAGSVTSSSSSATVSIGEYSTIDTVTVSSGGELTNSATGSAILVSGANSQIVTGITNDGSITGNITTGSTGTISGGIDNNATLTGAIVNAGLITGNIDNSGSISGGITSTGTISSGGIINTGTISGGVTVADQTATDVAAYQSTGAGTLSGGLTIRGNVTSNDADGSVVIGDGSMNATAIDNINIESTGVLTSTGAGTKAIVVTENTTVTGSITNEGTITGHIENSGSIAGGINSTNTLNGGISNTGSIAGGVSVSTQDSGGDSAYVSSGNGSLTGGLSINSAVMSSSSTGAVVIGDGTTTNATAIDNIRINSTGSLTSAGTDTKAIVVTADTSVTGSITNEGTITGHIENSGTIAGGINSTNILNGGISNTGTIAGGVSVSTQDSGGDSAYVSSGNGSLTGGLIIAGTVTSANDTGALVIGDGTANSNTIDSISIVSGGTLTATGSGQKAIVVTAGNQVTGGITNSGSITGTIENSGIISGGVRSGGQTAENQVYLGKAGSTLNGSFEITSGTVTSTAAHAIELESSARVGNITVTAGTLSAQAAGKNAIHLNNGASLGDGTPVESETIINIGSSGDVRATQGTGIYIATEGSGLTGNIEVAGSLNGGISAIIVAENSVYNGTIENSGTISGKILIAGNHSAINDALLITSVGQLSSVGGDTIIEVTSGASLSSSAGNAINIAGTTTGKILVNGAISDGKINIASSGNYTGSIDLDDGSVADGISISGNHTTSGNGINIINGGSVGSVSSKAIHVTSTGNLNASGDRAINLNGGTLTGTIRNEGDISGDIYLNGTQNIAGSSYYSQGTSGDRATLSGSYIVADGQSITTSEDAVYLGPYSDITNVTIGSGSTLRSTGANKRAIYIAENAHLNSGAESNEALTVNGALTSDAGAALEVQGALTGKLMINATGSVTGKGGATDAAILLDGSGTHNGSIENRGVIRGGIYIDQNQTADNQAYLSQGLVSDRAVLVGVNDQGGGYTIDDGVTVTSTGSDTLVVGGYSYVDSVVVSGTLSTTAGTSGSVGGNNAIRIASGGQLGGNDAGTGVNRLETDTVLDIEGIVSSVSGYAVQMDGVVTGVIRVDDGASLVGDTADGSIAINSVYTGAIRNLGTITGDIDVSNRHQVTSGPLLYLTDNASVDGNYVVKNGGFAFSASGTEILTEGTSNMTGVVVESGGTLGIDTSETVRTRSGATIDNVTVAGTLAGTVRSDGDIKVVSVELGGRHRASSDHALAVESGGTVENVTIKGTSYSTASQIGLLTSLASDKSAIYVANGGTLGTTEGTTAATINGQVTSTLGHAIEIAGTARGAMNIGQYGLVYSGEAADSGIKIGGSYTGRIYNQGEVASGITVYGSHISSTQAYYAKGNSSTAKSKLTGGYRVMNGGSVSSNASHAVHLDEYSETDFIEVSGSSSSIKANADGQSAIYVADNAKLGNGITGIGITSGGLITGTSNVGSAAIKVDGTLSGNIAVSSGGQLGNNTTAYAVDFANADTALNFVQTGSSSFTKGRVQGSSLATDIVSIREGSFEGNLTGVEHLIISDDSYIKMHGDFTLPGKTTVYLDNNLNAGKSLITSTGTVYASADRSNLTFVPEDNDAYLNLYRSGPVITVVDAQGVDENAVDLIDVDSGSVLLQTEKYVENNSIKVRLKASTSEDVNGVMGQALLAALDPNADPVKSQQILTTLNQDEDVVGDIEDDVRADTTGYAYIAPREMALATQNIVFDRIDSLRTGGLNFGDDGYGFGLYGNSYDDGDEARDEEDEQQEYEPDSDPVSTSRYRQVRQMDYTLINGGTFWGQMMYLEGNHDEKNGSDGFNNRAGGIVLGIDSVVLDSFRLGIAATYGFGVVNTEGDRSTESHNFLGTVYGSWERGSYFVDILLTLGTAQNDTDKKVENQTVTGDYTSKQWNLKTVAGYRFPVGDSWEFTPIVEFNYGQVRFDAYDEKGTVGTEQKIEIQDYSALEMGLGFTLRGLFHNGSSYVEPDFTFKAYSDLNTTGSKVQYTFLAGGPSAFVEGPERDRQRYLTSFGLYFDMGSNWFIRTGYDYRWSQHYRSHAFNAKFRYHF